METSSSKVSLRLSYCVFRVEDGGEDELQDWYESVLEQEDSRGDLKTEPKAPRTPPSRTDLTGVPSSLPFKGAFVILEVAVPRIVACLL